MSDSEPPQISILDARLAEIDQRLRTIQTGLVEEPPPVTPPEPVAPPEPPPPVAARTPSAVDEEEPAELVEELRGLAADHRGLLTSLRSLLADYERLAETARGPETAPVSVTAGPFAGTDAVRAFQQALAGLPGVAQVELRGYEGPDRAVLDVHLAPPTS
jgi:hypothetical protein